MIENLEKLCKHNSDPEADYLEPVEAIGMEGKITEKNSSRLQKLFFESFIKADIAPSMIVVEGEYYTAYFENQTENYSIPTSVEQIIRAMAKIAELYAAEEYGVTNIFIPYDEEKKVLKKSCPPEKRLNPDKDFYKVYGSKPTDLCQIIGDIKGEWIIGKDQPLEVGSPMLESERKGKQGTVYVMAPKTDCPPEFYHQTMKMSYENNLFVKEVICETNKQLFHRKLTKIIDSMSENDKLVLNDFQKLQEKVSFEELTLLMCNTSGKGSVLISNEKNTQFLDFWTISSLQEFSASMPFVDKILDACSDLFKYV